MILGVSVDPAESHKEFCAKEGLNFKLLADTDAKVPNSTARAWSTMARNSPRATRSSEDPQGKVAKVFEKVKVGGHSEEVLAALASLQKQ